MIIDTPDDMHGFTARPMAGKGWETAWVSDEGGAPIILIHELPMITPEVMHLARVFAAERFKVYLPSLMGRPGQVATAKDKRDSALGACVRSEILGMIPGNFTRGAVSGLRALADAASAEAGNSPVGVIGLCLTGGFAIATATEGSVAAAVACEPSVPLPPFGGQIDLDASDQTAIADRVRAGALDVRLYRFQGDRISPCARVKRYGQAFPLESRCLPNDSADKTPSSRPKYHSVVTNDLVEAPGSLTQAARDEIVALFRWRLRGEGSMPPLPTGLRDCLKSGCANGRW